MMATNPVLSSSESGILCDICQQNDIDDNDIPTATHYCTDCNENHCSKCSKFHGRLNATKDHKLVNIDVNLVRKVDSLELFEEDCYQNKMTQIEQQEYLENPVHADLPPGVQKLVKKGSDRGIENKTFEQKLEVSREESQNLAEGLQESKKETTETGEQNRILKESSDKALPRFESLKRKFEKLGNKNLEQELQESRKETAKMKEQYRILKENLDKALDREKNLKKELDAFKSRSKSDIFGNVREALATTSESSSQQQSHTTSSSESSKLIESKVFVFGIADAVSITNDIVKINLNQSNDVSKAQYMPVEMIRESAAAVHCDSIFVTGIGKKCDEIWRFNATSSKWKKCASLVQGRECHSVAFVDHILYICGGGSVSSKKKTLDDVEAYDTRKDHCVTVGKLANAHRSSGNCVPFKSSLYIFGGLDAKNQIANKVQVFHTNLNKCTLLSKPMPRFQYPLRAALWENTVILLGYDCCFTYNFETEVWNVRDQFKTGVVYFGLTVSNRLVFVIGGGYSIKDTDGNNKSIYRDDVRCVPVVNILNDEAIEWKHHAKLPKPSLVHAFVRIDFGLK